MTPLSIIYLVYMFIALYMFFLFIVIYLRNKKNLFSYPKAKKQRTVSVLIPIYNEEKTIKQTVEAVLQSDYKKLVEVIVINDGSIDKTSSIIKDLMKKYKKLKLLNKKHNTGKADSLNIGIKIAEGELIALVDADSYPKKDAIRKMIGFFDNERVGSVTGTILVKNKKKRIGKMQALEYYIIAWTRKMLGYIDGIWVTPGPLSIYRKSALLEVGGFDKKNMTEDVELTWNLISHNYKIEMCLSAVAYTTVPETVRGWWRQRIRWDIGGLQTLHKYKSAFLRHGILSSFIIPFFAISMFLGVIGVSIFFFLIIRRIINTYLFTKYSLTTSTALLTTEELYITPTILNFFGIFLFIIGFVFLMMALIIMREKELRSISKNFFKHMFFLIFYLSGYPLILVASIYKIWTGRYKW